MPRMLKQKRNVRSITIDLVKLQDEEADPQRY